jgi:hypothetical protein
MVLCEKQFNIKLSIIASWQGQPLFALLTYTCFMMLFLCFPLGRISNVRENLIPSSLSLLATRLSMLAPHVRRAAEILFDQKDTLLVRKPSSHESSCFVYALSCARTCPPIVVCQRYSGSSASGAGGGPGRMRLRSRDLAQQ